MQLEAENVADERKLPTETLMVFNVKLNGIDVCTMNDDGCHQCRL